MREVPAFEDIPKIDAHAHIFDDIPELVHFMERVDLRIVNVCFGGLRPEGLVPMERQAEFLHRTHPGQFHFCSTYDLTQREEPDYATRVNAWIDTSREAGALMVKLWKEVGMQVRTASGTYLMPDAPVFDTIYAHLADIGMPLLTHLADPVDGWRPLDPESTHFGYYSKHQEWYMLGKEGAPTHEQIIASRDRIIEKHPALTCIAAHLGSLEHDLDALAARLDRYPNLYIDTAARKRDLARYPAHAVRDFFIRYQDRILYGTDFDSCRALEAASFPEETRKACAAALEQGYRADFHYFAHTGITQSAGREVEGLGLPHSVLEKLYHRNAQRLMPGLGA